VKAFINMLLAAYIGFVACYPCNDVCVDDGVTEVEAFSCSEHEDANENEACTPFCFYSCCTPHIICQISFLHIPAAFHFSEQLNQHYAVNLVAEIFLTIWQPPKI
jgi:hypothetical protein